MHDRGRVRRGRPEAVVGAKEKQDGDRCWPIIPQRELAERVGVPVTMISAYERDQRQPTLGTLLRLLRAAGFDLRLHLAAHDPHDDILAKLEAGRSEADRQARDRQLQAWREAVPAEDVA